MAYLLGSTGLLHYYAFDIQAPVPAVVALAISAPLLITCVVLLCRGLLVRRRPVLAVLGFACGWTSVEYLVALVGPTGSNWSLANSQADLLPVLQVASATGLWGVTFVVTLVPATIAALCALGIRPAARLRVGATGAVILAIALTYGFIQLDTRVGPTVRVTTLAGRADADEPHLGTSAGDALLAADLAAVRAIPPGSTRIVVLPEKDFIADDSTLPAVNSGFTAAAKEGRFDIVVGLGVWTRGLRYNTALAFPADGGARSSTTNSSWCQVSNPASRPAMPMPSSPTSPISPTWQARPTGLAWPSVPTWASQRSAVAMRGRVHG